MTDRDRLSAIRERHEKATPGEWRAGSYLAVRGQTGTVEVWCDGKWKVHIATVFPVQTGWDSDEEIPLPVIAEDEAFIAHAHQDIPYLLSQLSAAEKALAEARAEGIEAAAKWHENEANEQDSWGGPPVGLMRPDQHRRAAKAIRALKGEAQQ
jgi:hypothetical protein